MGPEKELLELALRLIARFGLSCDPYSLAYEIQGWCDEQEHIAPPPIPRRRGMRRGIGGFVTRLESRRSSVDSQDTAESVVFMPTWKSTQPCARRAAMDKHIDALLELRFGCRFDAEWSQEAAEQVAAIDAAIALMRGQSEVVGFYIATFKHKDNGGAVTWWGPNDAGYTPDLATAGVYTELTAGYHENEYTVPVPVSFIKGLRVRRTVDPGDSLNRAFWSANHLREAIAATYAPPKDTADEQ